jgi:hypothetical protein
MKATQALRDLESSLWLHNITRGLLQHYIEDFSVAGSRQTSPSLIMLSRTAMIMMAPSVRNWRKASRARRSFF